MLPVNTMITRFFHLLSNSKLISYLLILNLKRSRYETDKIMNISDSKQCFKMKHAPVFKLDDQ